MEESALGSSEFPVTVGVYAKASDTFLLLDWRAFRIPRDPDIL